jgi:hypothetical protein
MTRVLLLLAAWVIVDCSDYDVVWECTCTSTCDHSFAVTQDAGSICAPLTDDDTGVAYNHAMRECGRLKVECGDGYLTSFRIDCEAQRDRTCP